MANKITPIYTILSVPQAMKDKWINSNVDRPSYPLPLLIMSPRKKSTGTNQVTRRSERIQGIATPSVSGDSGSVPMSLTPVPSISVSSNRTEETDRHGEPKTTRPTEDQSEEDEFMPSTQEVAATLAAMKARRCEPENRGHEVCCTESLGAEPQASILNSKSPPSRNDIQWEQKVRFNFILLYFNGHGLTCQIQYGDPSPLSFPTH